MNKNKTLVNQGFILTRNSFDLNNQAQIELWLSTIEGPVKLIIADQQPLFFIEESQLDPAQKLLYSISYHYDYKKLKLKKFNQNSVIGLYFKNLKYFYEAKSILKSNRIEIFESDFRLEDRFLMERFVCGGVEFIGQAAKKNGFIEYSNAKIKPDDYVPQLKVVSIDIECSEKGELFSIGFYGVYHGDIFQRVLMINNNLSALAEDYIQWVNDEADLLLNFVTLINGYDPDIIIGWNVINFDFRLLYQRGLLLGLQLNIGRNQRSMTWRDSRTEKNQGFISIDGRVVIDGIAALKAESYNFPSFSLEAIAQHFLGQGKKTDNVDDRLAEILFDFKHNKNKLAAYNLQDCILAWDIFEKIKLLDYLIFRSQLTGLELDRVGGSVAAFTNLYLPKLHRLGYISPNLPEGGGLASPGGYVMTSKPGFYKNVLVLDFKSLYPSIIRTFKIDPLGLIEGQLSPENAIQGFRGGVFSRDKHILPEIITQLWSQRDQAKKEKDQARSQAIKIIMNSFYGVLGSGGCAFYDTKLASSITLRGHAIMQQTAQWIEEQGLTVIYGDTDSTFVLLDEKIDGSEANQIGQDLAKLVNQNWQDKLHREYQIDCFLEIEFESHFSRFLMPTIRNSELGSKKRYAGLINKNGEEILVFKGLENVRTDWTELAKKFQKKLYKMIFHDQDPTAFILETVEQTITGKYNADLIYRKRLRRALDSYVKNIPPHVKAARLADVENLNRGKTLKYQHKGWINYLMTVNGPQPIEYVTSNIDYQHYIDKQVEPIADGILPFIGLSFEQIVNQQMGLF